MAAYVSGNPATTSLNISPDQSTLEGLSTQDLFQMVHVTEQGLDVPKSQVGAVQQLATPVSTSHALVDPTYAVSNSDEDVLFNMLGYSEEICASGNELCTMKTLPGIEKFIKKSQTVQNSSEQVVYCENSNQKDLLCCCGSLPDREEVPDDQIFVKNEQMYRLPHVGFLSLGSKDFCGFERNGEWHISLLEVMSKFSATLRCPFEMYLSAKGNSMDFLSLCVEELEYLRQRKRCLEHMLTTRLLSLCQFREISLGILRENGHSHTVYRTFRDIVESKCFLKKCTNMKCSKCGRPITQTPQKDTYIMIEEPDYSIVCKEKAVSPHQKNTFKVGTVNVGGVVFTAFQVDGQSYICVRHLTSRNIISLSIVQYRLQLLEKHTRKAPSGLDFYFESHGLKLAKEDWIDLVTLQCICCLGANALNHKCFNGLQVYNRLAKGQFQECYNVEMEVIDDMVGLPGEMQLEPRINTTVQNHSETKSQKPKEHHLSRKSKGSVKNNEHVKLIMDSESACNNNNQIELQSDRLSLGNCTLVFLKQNGLVLTESDATSAVVISNQTEAVTTGIKRQKKGKRKTRKSDKPLLGENIHVKPRYLVQSRLRKKFDDDSQTEQGFQSPLPQTAQSPLSQISEYTASANLTEKQRQEQGLGHRLPVLKTLNSQALEPCKPSSSTHVHTQVGNVEACQLFNTSVVCSGHQPSSTNVICSKQLKNLEPCSLPNTNVVHSQFKSLEYCQSPTTSDDRTDEFINNLKNSEKSEDEQMHERTLQVIGSCDDISRLKGNDKLESTDVILFQSKSGQLLQCTPLFSLDDSDHSSKTKELDQVCHNDNAAPLNSELKDVEKSSECIISAIENSNVADTKSMVDEEEGHTVTTVSSVAFTPSSPSTPNKNALSTPLSSPIISRSNEDFHALVTESINSEDSFSNSLNMLAESVNQSNSSSEISEIKDWNLFKEKMMGILSNLLKHIDIRKCSQHGHKLQLEMLLKCSSEESYPGMLKSKLVLTCLCCRDFLQLVL